MAKVAGSIWVEGSDIHYIDQFGREWYCPAYGIKGSSAQPGSIWVDPNDHYLYYTDVNGTVCYTQTPWGDALAPANAVVGSIWVGSDNQLHWIAPYDANYKHNVRAHNDTAAHSDHTDTHTDAHQDAIHSDIAHNDRAHTDTHGDTPHNDWHTDQPHQDSHTDTHSDQAGYNFGDHIDCNIQAGTANGHYTSHTDCWSWPYPSSPDPNPSGSTHTDGYHADTHGDYPNNWYGGVPPHDDYGTHYDIAHVDTHGDVAHVDQAAYYQHGDQTFPPTHNDISHLDTPHTDVAHVDAHQDTHTDTHGDTAHIDYPIYIGP
jgi:hypothetical protein